MEQSNSLCGISGSFKGISAIPRGFEAQEEVARRRAKEGMVVVSDLGSRELDENIHKDIEIHQK
jgi:hypothetical protein